MRMSKPLYFRLKKYLLIGLIFTTIGVYVFFIFHFAGKMSSEELKLKGELNFKPLTNTYHVSVSIKTKSK